MVEGLPVRLRLVVVAPVGRQTEVNAGEVESLLENLQRGLAAIVQKINNFQSGQHTDTKLFRMRGKMLEDDTAGAFWNEQRARIGVAREMTLRDAVLFGWKRNAQC